MEVKFVKGKTHMRKLDVEGVIVDRTKEILTSSEVQRNAFKV